jgi:hypothetical protein
MEIEPTFYTINIPSRVQVRLAASNKKSPGIATRLTELLTNPYAKARKTNMPVIGSYYVNAGRYAILFEINEESKTIDCLAVVLRPFLYKMIKGKIHPQNIWMVS